MLTQPWNSDTTALTPDPRQYGDQKLYHSLTKMSYLAKLNHITTIIKRSQQRGRLG